jgi:hypothetical protein
MSNYELVTIKKGEVKTVDAFIKAFNAVGANMKVLSIGAYDFLTSDDVEIKKQFQLQVMDELKMSKTTLSFLKTAGLLYRIDDLFYKFAYTNVIYFKKAVDFYNEYINPRYTIQLWNDDVAQDTIDGVHNSVVNMLTDIALTHNSYIDKDIDTVMETLLSLSQKELKSLIEKYIAVDVTEDTEDTEDTTDDTSDDTTDDTNVYYTYYDDDILDIINRLEDGYQNEKITKQALKDLILSTIIELKEKKL